jgi:hypothetical protein
MIDAWYIIVKAAEFRDGCEDLESTQTGRRAGYQPIAQFDHTYQQQVGVLEQGGDNPTYAEAAAGSSSQNKPAPGGLNRDTPPSYSAVVKGGIFPSFIQADAFRPQSSNLSKLTLISF